jgi:UDP-N-acetyl-2-amino-2-deoxyglucuronate dehydrogenase
MPKNFALTGCAGYIAPRHLEAIHETGNNLLAVLDPHDSVGVLDRYFEDVEFFSEFERFDRHIEKIRDTKDKIDYVSICSPNYLHDAHVRFAFRVGADAICEKPLVLNPDNLDELEKLEKRTGKKVYSIMQLRLHPEIKNLKREIEEAGNKKHNIDLKYITFRGPWYNYSWKGDVSKSGGLATNLGIHFFDMLIWIFGNVKNYGIDMEKSNKVKGFLELDKAYVDWFLSIDKKDIPQERRSSGKKFYRSLSIDNKKIDFSSGFENLHTESYKKVFLGQGFTISDVRPSIKLVSNLRNIIY